MPAITVSMPGTVMSTTIPSTTGRPLTRIPPAATGIDTSNPALALVRRQSDLAPQHLLDGVERIHELLQFDNAAAFEPEEVGDE